MKKSHSCFLTAFQLHWQKGSFSFWDRGDLNWKDLWFIKKGNVTYEAGFPHRPEVRKRGQPWWLPSVFPPEIYVTGWARDLPGDNGSAQAPRVDAVGWSSVILGFPGSPLLWDPICMCCIYCLQLSFKKGHERDSLKEHFVTSTVSIFSPVMYKIQMIEMERYVRHVMKVSSHLFPGLAKQRHEFVLLPVAPTPSLPHKQVLQAHTPLFASSLAGASESYSRWYKTLPLLRTWPAGPVVAAPCAALS